MALRADESVLATPLQFDAFYAEHVGRVRNLIRRRAAPAEVDDLAQETFLRAYRNSHTFDLTKPAWPWLATIAKNVTLDHSRRSCNSREQPALSADRPDTGADPAERFQDADRRDAIVTALAAVGERHRRVLFLRELEDLRYKQVAEREGVSVDAVKALLRRAREAFRIAYGAIADERGLWGVAAAPVLAARRFAARLGASTATTIAELAAVPMAVAMAAALSVVGSWAHGGHGNAPSRPTSPIRLATAPTAALATTTRGRIPQPRAVPGGRTADKQPTTGPPFAVAGVRVGLDASGRDLREHDHLKITVFGHRVFEEEGTTSTPCDANPARQAACDLLRSVPEEINIGSPPS